VSALTSCRVLRTYPHDPAAFTQGLCWAGGALYESTGLVGASTVRKVRLKDGRVLLSRALAEPLFGEGLTAWGDEILSTTWRGGRGFRWDLATLEPRGGFAYEGEAWGLTEDGESLVMSDGTPVLRFFDPDSFALRRRLLVTAGGRPLPLLNELQWVKGELLANVLTVPAIARIDPGSGAVRSWIDLSAIVQEAAGGDSEKVANGIAYDSERDRLLVTGKNWSRLFEIEYGP
jgi:glutaminyl-peptide cyclotransferase